MNKPYTVCQMVISIDGKVVGGFDMRSDLYPAAECCMQHTKKEGFDAIAGGRITMEAFNSPTPIDYSKFQGQKVDRSDFVANNSHGYYMVCVDPSGKVQWTNAITNSEFDVLGNAHVIAVLSESVSDEYLAYLKEIGVSYIFGGKKRKMDMAVVADKLVRLFGIKKMAVAGGPTVLGSFAEADLFDELQLTIAPLTAPNLPKMQLFENDNVAPALYDLMTVEQYKENVLWLKYKKNNLKY